MWIVKPGSTSSSVGDFNEDRRPDLALVVLSETSPRSQGVSILIGRGDGTFAPQTFYETGLSRPPTTYDLVVGDFNEDGRSDLAVASPPSNISVLMGRGDGTFGPATTLTLGGIPLALAAGDFDGDGHEDLVATSGLDGTVSVILGDGDGTFGAESKYDTGAYPASVAVGDLNGDGRLDLAIGNALSADVSILLGRGDGSFDAQNRFLAGAVPLSLAIGNVNGNRRPDVAVVNSE